MIQTLFSIDAFVTPIDKWKSKKAKIKKLTKEFKYHRRDLTSFETTRFDPLNKNLTNILFNVFSDEFTKFGKECGFGRLNITDSWIVRYKQHDYQITHHHGKVMYSGIIYLDLDPKQEATTFIAPWPNETNGQTKLTNLKCKEGSMIIFPGHLLHFVNPNILKKERNIISFDMNCDVENNSY